MDFREIDPQSRRWEQMRRMRLSVVDKCEEDIQNYLDKKAKEYGYDSILSAVSYLNSTNPKYAVEAAGFLQWRDSVWGAAEALVIQLKQGVISAPTSEADLAARLPAFPLA